MKLRKPCEHDRYEAHYYDKDDVGFGPLHCPGGEFLADDALVIEKVDGEWPDWAVKAGLGYGVVEKLVRAKAVALTVREGAE